MSVLDSVIQMQEQDRQRQESFSRSIGDAAAYLTQLNMARQKQKMDELMNQAQIRDIDSKIEERKKTSPLDELITRGKAAEAARMLGDEETLNAILGKSEPKTANEFMEPEVAENTPKIPLDPELAQYQKAQKKVYNPLSGDFEFSPEALIAQRDIKLKEKELTPTAAKEKRDVELGELRNKATSLVQEFETARKTVEGFKVPGIKEKFGEQGMGGRIVNKVATIKGWMGDLPEVSSYQNATKAFATTIAKAAGEQRPTDQDIIRFLGTLPNLDKNDAENKIAIDRLLNDLQIKGADAVWNERAKENKNNVIEGITPSGLKYKVIK